MLVYHHGRTCNLNFIFGFEKRIDVLVLKLGGRHMSVCFNFCLSYFKQS